MYMLWGVTLSLVLSFPCISPSEVLEDQAIDLTPPLCNELGGQQSGTGLPQDLEIREAWNVIAVREMGDVRGNPVRIKIGIGQEKSGNFKDKILL